VRVEVTDDVLAQRRVEGARAEARRDARGHPAHAQQHRHRARELLAVAAPVAEQEGVERIFALRRRLVVGVAAAQVALDGQREVVRRLGAGLQALREREGPRVGRARDRRGAGRARQAVAVAPAWALVGVVPGREADDAPVRPARAGQRQR
jgi:hypothetical protein